MQGENIFKLLITFIPDDWCELWLLTLLYVTFEITQIKDTKINFQAKFRGREIQEFYNGTFCIINTIRISRLRADCKNTAQICTHSSATQLSGDLSC